MASSTPNIIRKRRSSRSISYSASAGSPDLDSRYIAFYGAATEDLISRILFVIFLIPLGGSISMILLMLYLLYL